MSQTELADRLGLTFQQVQKYESGSNRVSCSRLAELCQILEVSVTFFFSNNGNEGTGLFDDLDLSMIKDGRRLISAFQKIPSAETRRRAIDLLETIAASAGGAN
jgi:transcriptional regulator with XRE-family HTH domain